MVRLRLRRVGRKKQPSYRVVAAEKEAMRYVEEGLPLVIVNPTRVYGTGHLTEGNTEQQACERMAKALRRTSKKK